MPQGEVDCDGCVAPCCTTFHPSSFSNKARWSSERLLREAQKQWKGNLVPLVFRAPLHGNARMVAGCNALDSENRCGIYAERPEPCRIYDCRTDSFRLEEGETPRCVWPRV